MGCILIQKWPIQRFGLRITILMHCTAIIPHMIYRMPCRTHKGPEHLFGIVCIPSKLYIICSFLRLWKVTHAGPQAIDAISIKKNHSQWYRVMVFNTTFSNVSAISWRWVLLAEEARVPGENHRPAANHWQTITYCYIEYTSPWVRFELITLVVIGTGFVGSCISNYIRSRPRRPLAMIWQSSCVLLKQSAKM